MATASSSPALSESLAPRRASISQPSRVISVDLLRGLVMIVMALDHTRDFCTNIPFPPEDVARTSGTLFFTRFITHYCAPVFFLLAGTGASLAVSQGKRQISRFLWTRGLWLIFLEFTVLGFAWSFLFPFGTALVVWALGWSMIALALIVLLPVRWIAAISVIMIATHNLLDRINPATFGRWSGLWMILHTPGFYLIKPPAMGLFVSYPLIPWIGVMAGGYALGWLFTRPDRRKNIFILGVALTLLFLVLRGINHYGNGIAGQPFGMPFGAGPWSHQPTSALTVISFLNTLKYPPSLDFLLMTLGPALILLSWFDGIKGEPGVARILLVYGRVPMFYYILHIFVIHLTATGVAALFHQPFAWLLRGGFFTQARPGGYGHGLAFVYAIWILVVVVLYFPCRWYMEFKRRHRDWSWLGYL
jgi:uncharacterized membrane protein